MVEWKAIGDIVKRNKGIPITASQMAEFSSEDGDIKVFAAGQTEANIKSSLLPKGCANSNPSIIVKSRGYIDFVFYNKPFTHKNEMWSYSFDDEKLCKFVYYYLTTKTQEFRAKAKANSVKLPQLCVADTDKYIIPIPPIAVQERIVGILDTFTASIDNLKEQIAQRRKQYEHYRDQLLDLEGKPGVEMKTLGEIGKCVAGATPSTKENSYWDNGTIPWMSSGEVHQGVVTHTASFITQKGYDNASTKMLPIGTVVIALAGQGKTRGTAAITAIELCTNQSLCGVVIDDDKILNKYVFFYLKTRYNDLRRVSSGDGTRGGLNLKMIGAYPIPLPSLSEQQRIVSILDTFEASIANLEAQLAERQKQYEYYRNRLLTFD